MSAKHPSGKNPPTDGTRFQDLEALLADRTPARRVLGARHLTAELSSSDLGDDEREVLERLLRRAASDTEHVVRVALATGLCKSRYLPREVALVLADDALTVAKAILEKSPALLDEDLMRIVAECDGRKQVCVARRTSLSSAVAAAVVASGNAAAVAALVENSSAAVDEGLLCRVLDRYGRFETVKSAIFSRGDLPTAICARLQKLAPVTPREDDAGEQAPTASATGARVQMSQLHDDGQLTASAVLQALCKGDIGFAEEAMAEIAGLSAEKAALLIHDASPFGLKAIYRQCAFPDALFPAFRVAVDLVQQREASVDQDAFADVAVERILEKYRELEVCDLDYLLVKLGRKAA